MSTEYKPLYVTCVTPNHRKPGCCSLILESFVNGERMQARAVDIDRDIVPLVVKYLVMQYAGRNWRTRLACWLINSAKGAK